MKSPEKTTWNVIGENRKRQTCGRTYSLVKNKKPGKKITGLSSLMCIVMSLSFGRTGESYKNIFQKINDKIISG